MSCEQGILLFQHDLKLSGGSEISTTNLVSEWNSTFGRISVISPYTADAMQVEHNHRLWGTNQKIPTRAEINKVVAYLNEQSPDFILLNHPDVWGSAFFMWFPPEMRAKTFAVWRGLVDDDTPKAESVTKRVMRQSIYNPVIHRIQRKVGNAVLGNFATSEATAQSLVNIGIEPSKISYVPEQVGGEFSPALRKNYGLGMRKEVCLDVDELGVLIVSRISPEKGIEWVNALYESLRTIRKDLHPNAYFQKLTIAVAGGASDQLSTYLKHLQCETEEITRKTKSIHGADTITIKWLGNKNHSQLQELYCGFDVLLAPSPAEGFGRVTVEAMSSGMTIIGRSSCRATSEILNTPVTTGVLVNNPHEAAIELIQLMQNPSLLFELQENACQWGNGEYSVENAVQQLHGAIERYKAQI